MDFKDMTPDEKANWLHAELEKLAAENSALKARLEDIERKRD